VDGPVFSVSVIIPSRGRPGLLVDCLAALAAQEYPPAGFEVIVVVDGAGEPAPGALAGLRQRLALTLVAQPAAGPAAARNRGARLARGECLAFTDADCRPAPDWLSRLAEASARQPGCALGGCTRNALPGNLPAMASQMLLDYLLARCNQAPGRATFFPSNNLLVPAEAFRALGGFAADYPLAAGEDRDFCRRWRAAGNGLAGVPEAVVWHAHPLTVGGFWRQQYHYGQGARRFHRPPAAAGRPVRFEPVSFYAGLLRYPFRAAAGGARWPLFGLFVLSQAAVAAGYLAPLRRSEAAGGGGATRP